MIDAASDGAGMGQDRNGGPDARSPVSESITNLVTTVDAQRAAPACNTSTTRARSSPGEKQEPTATQAAASNTERQAQNSASSPRAPSRRDCRAWRWRHEAEVSGRCPGVAETPPVSWKRRLLGDRACHLPVLARGLKRRALRLFWRPSVAPIRNSPLSRGFTVQG